MSNFSEILDRAPSEIERPKPLPEGTYTALIKGLYEEVKSSKKQTPGVKFNFQILAADEDVDPDALTEWMTRQDGSSKSLQDATISTTYWITEGAAFMLTDFLGHLGLGEDFEGSIRAALQETPNRQVKIFIGHRPSEDGKSLFAEVKSTAPAE